MVDVFTASELENIANQTLDFYLKDQIWKQSLQDRPAMEQMLKHKKLFGGGKDYIKGNVKGDYTTQFMGYEGDEQVEYSNPANVKQFQFPWKELHAGIKITGTELKKAGITVNNSLSGLDSTSPKSDQALFQITDLLEDKLDDMDEGSARSFNSIIWGDGTSDSKVFAGIRHFITDTPTTGIVGGIDRASNSWWRNRALVGASKVTSSRTNQTLSRALRQEVRQLRRYRGKPSLILCGSTFLEALDQEITEKGSYTDEGFMKAGSTDISMADFSMKGVGKFHYDPTLDDLGFADRAYFIDPRHLKLMPMRGEENRAHSPARPHDRYVFYKAVTWTGTMICNKMNAHGVYQAATS